MPCPEVLLLLLLHGVLDVLGRDLELRYLLMSAEGALWKGSMDYFFPLFWEKRE